MIPDSDFIRVSFFLAQRPTKADSSAPPRCHSTWRNAHYRIDRNGNFSIANGAVITDIVALDAGSWYNIQATFITTAINDGSSNGAGYQFGSITKSGGATTSWNNVATINTSLGYSRLLVRDRSGAQSGGLLLDNVSVVNAIPEPSSALLVLGGSLLAFRRRRASI